MSGGARANTVGDGIPELDYSSGEQIQDDHEREAHISTQKPTRMNFSISFQVPSDCMALKQKTRTPKANIQTHQTLRRVRDWR